MTQCSPNHSPHSGFDAPVYITYVTLTSCPLTYMVPPTLPTPTFKMYLSEIWDSLEKKS
jgi:hypothetical protein